MNIIQQIYYITKCRKFQQGDEAITAFNFDILANGVKTSGETVTDESVVYKAAELPFNVTEYQVYGDDEFLIVTAYIHTYLAEYSNLTSIEYVLRGASGDVCEVLDFAITTDGVHGFDTTVDSTDP